MGITYDQDGLPFNVQGDPNVKEGGQYAKFEKGNYTVTGIGAWFKKCTDDKEFPVFVPSADGQQMVVRFNLRMEDGTDGPPITTTRPELVCLVRAFGGDVSQLPKEESTRFLLAAKDQANKGAKKRQCAVDGDGWTRIISVEGALPPVGEATDPIKYQWKYVGARSGDGTSPVRFATPKNTQFSTDPVAFFTFELAGDEFGTPTPYDGFTLDVRVYNPFDGTYDTTPIGKVPRTALGAKGGIPASVNRMIRFYSLFCPELARYSWESDPEKSSLGIDEIANPLAVIDRYARQGGHRAISPILFTQPKNKEYRPKPKLDIGEMLPVAGVVIDRDAQTKAEMQQSSKLNTLYDFLLKLSGKTLFEPTPKDSAVIQFNFTDEGRDWAKAVLAPAWAALDLPVTKGSRLLGKLTDEEIDRLMTHLKPPFDLDDEEVANAPEQGF